MMKHDGATLVPGTCFKQYRIESLLGEGAMGAVYRATHTGLDKRVVVKVLHPQHARSSTIRERFFREGRAAGAIRHPHVVDVTDVGEHEGIAFLVMEYLEGETLGVLLKRSGALNAEHTAALMLPIVAAVDAAHAAGVVHRDLKPDNLFIARTATGAAHPKVLDFGISRVVDEGGRRTSTTAVLGTPAYMAPEQFKSTRDADARSDQYALGVILYECVTGHAAFSGDNIYTILRRVGDGDFVRPSQIPVVLPSGLEAIVLRAMSLDPSARFSSLRALGASLLPYADAHTRNTWSVVFSPSIEPTPSSDMPSTVLLQQPFSIGAPSDTLVDAAQVRNTTSTPRDHRRRMRVFALATVAFALVCVATLFVLQRQQGHVTRQIVRQPPVALVPAPVVSKPAPITPMTPTIATMVPAVQITQDVPVRRTGHHPRPPSSHRAVTVPRLPP